MILTMAKLYPIQRLSQLGGQSGIFISWLWTAITFVCTSQTTHLNTHRHNTLHSLTFYLEMNSAIAGSATDIIGIGSLVESQ